MRAPMRVQLVRVLAALAPAIALSFAARASHASPISEITGAIGGNAGAQGVVSGPSAASAYFNPALLVEAEVDVLVSFGVVSEQVGVTLDGRRGGEVPLSVGDRQIVNPDLTPIPNTAVPTQWLQNGCSAGTEKGSCPPPGFSARPRQSQGSSGKTRSYLTLGFAKSILKDRLAIGAYAVLPVGSFTTARASYVDEREALFTNSLHPELYGDRLTAISLTGGIGLKLFPALSIGVGLSLGLTNSVASASYVRDSTNYDTLLLNNSIETSVSFAPIGGLRFVPASWLRFGATAHAPEQFVIDTNVTATLPSGTESKSYRSEERRVGKEC